MTRTATPSWIDVDAVIPADVQARVTATIAEGEQLEPTIRDYAMRAYDLTREVRDHMTRAGRDFPKGVLPGGLAEFVDEVSGHDALFELLVRLAQHLECVTESVAVEDPDWLVERKQREALSLD
jgi:hypothetical protein